MAERFSHLFYVSAPSGPYVELTLSLLVLQSAAGLSKEKVDIGDVPDEVMRYPVGEVEVIESLSSHHRNALRPD